MTSTWMSPVHGISRGKAYPRATARRSLALLACTAGMTSAGAVTVLDPTNDFIPTFAGAHSADLDVQSVFATYDGVNLHIGATLSGNVGTLPSALYVFGFHRGAGTANFAAIGLPDINFDAVVTMTGAGVTGGRDLVANTAITLPAGAAQISGATFQIDFPASLLPSRGRTPDQYGVNLWPRDASVVAGDTQIADFAPDSVDFVISPVGAIPEPAISLLFASGLAGLALARRRNSARRD